MALTQISTNGIKDANVNTADIADNAVTTAKIADGAIGAVKISNGQITGAKMASGAVGTSQLAADAVNTVKIANAAVTTAKIADQAVTAAKLASGVQTTINNNADNRVITGSSSANTLNAESSMIIDSSGNVCVGGNPEGFEFQVTDASGAAVIRAKDGANNKIVDLIANSTGGLVRTIGAYPLVFNTNQTERMRLDTSGNLLIGRTSYNAGAFGGAARGINVAGTQPQILLHETDTDKDGYFGLAGSLLRIQTADSIPFTIWTADTERLRVNADGKVGIGRTATFKLDVQDSTNNTFRLGNSGETGHGSHEVKIVGGRNYYHTLRFEGSSYRFLGFDGSSINEKFRVRSTGGVTFNGDTADANALDDYEEGTFTPYIGGGGNLGSWSGTSANGGFYVKIGRQVTCWMNVQGTVSGASGSAYVYGLPFSSAGINVPTGAGNANYSAGSVQYWSGAGSDVQGALIVSGNSRIYFHTDNGAATGGEPAVSNSFNNLHVQVCYWVA